MILEQKQISPTQILLYFPTPLPIIGTFLSKDNSSFSLIQNLQNTNLATDILLTKDFIYLETPNKDQLEDLYLTTLAELDDYSVTPLPQIAPNENIELKIKLLLKLVIAPFLNKDGGDIEFSSYTSNTVYVKFLGKCNGCPYATRTLKERVEKNLTDYIPDIKKAELV